MITKAFLYRVLLTVQNDYSLDGGSDLYRALLTVQNKYSLDDGSDAEQSANTKPRAPAEAVSACLSFKKLIDAIPGDEDQVIVGEDLNKIEKQCVAFPQSLTRIKNEIMREILKNFTRALVYLPQACDAKQGTQIGAMLPPIDADTVDTIPADRLDQALFQAVLKDQVEVVRALLERDANPNRFFGRANALHAAIIYQYHSIKSLAVLLEHSSTNPNLPFNRQYSDGKDVKEYPLAIAFRVNHQNAIVLLLDHPKINPNLKSRIETAREEKGTESKVFHPYSCTYTYTREAPLMQALGFSRYAYMVEKLLANPRTDFNNVKLRSDLDGETISEPGALLNMMTFRLCMSSSAHNADQNEKWLKFFLADHRMDLSEKTNKEAMWYKQYIDYYIKSKVPIYINKILFAKVYRLIDIAVNMRQLLSETYGESLYDFSYVIRKLRDHKMEPEEIEFIRQIVKNHFENVAGLSFKSMDALFDTFFSTGSNITIQDIFKQIKIELYVGELFIFNRFQNMSFLSKLKEKNQLHDIQIRIEGRILKQTDFLLRVLEKTPGEHNAVVQAVITPNMWLVTISEYVKRYLSGFEKDENNVKKDENNADLKKVENTLKQDEGNADLKKDAKTVLALENLGFKTATDMAAAIVTGDLQQQFKMIIGYRLRQYHKAASTSLNALWTAWQTNQSEEFYSKHLVELLPRLTTYCIEQKLNIKQIMKECLDESFSSQDARSLKAVIDFQNSKTAIEEKLVAEFGQFGTDVRNDFTRAYHEHTAVAQSNQELFDVEEEEGSGVRLTAKMFSIN